MDYNLHIGLRIHLSTTSTILICVATCVVTHIHVSQLPVALKLGEFCLTTTGREIIFHVVLNQYRPDYFNSLTRNWLCKIIERVVVFRIFKLRYFG